MTIEQEIKSGADALIRHSAFASDGEPELAIAQLLLAAVGIARQIAMPRHKLVDAVDRVLRDAGYQD
jgi:hypothetical protein